jgi:hypothetical protein
VILSLVALCKVPLKIGFLVALCEVPLKIRFLVTLCKVPLKIGSFSVALESATKDSILSGAL